MMSDNDSLYASPTECDAGVGAWRTFVAGADVSREMALTRYHSLQLDSLTIGFPAILGEFCDEMTLGANLLEAVADQLRVADQFDGTFDGLLAGTASTVAELQKSVDDDSGVKAIDLVDPDPANDDGDHTVHMGYLPLFGPGGPTASDVRQGSLGDCWLLGPTAGAAEVDPDRLEEIITDNGDGTYTVLVDGEHITVDDEFPVAYFEEHGREVLLYAQSEGALWPLIWEKACAIRYGGDYDDIESDGDSRAMDALGYESDDDVLNPSFSGDPDDADVAVDIQASLSAGMPVSAEADGAFGMGGGNKHVWAIVDVTEIDGVTYVTVANPWSGVDDANDVGPGMGQTAEGTWEYTGGADVGDTVDFARDGDGELLEVDGQFLRMPIDMFTANFDNIERVEGMAE